MNNRKPDPLYAQPRAGQVCAVCGQRTYSLNGIHPQCAVKQADAPRQLLLANEKRKARLAADAKPAASK